MILKRETHSDINITTATVVLTYTYTGDNPRTVLTRVELGDDTRPIQGGGIYVLDAKIDGHPVTPSSRITVAAAQARIVMQGRHLVLEKDDVLTIEITGLEDDTDVNVTATIVDATPAMVEDLVGVGSVLVDHNYGGTDALAYQTAAGGGIEGATIVAYLTENWDASERSQDFAKGKVQTDAAGRWARGMMLEPGAYTLLYYLQGYYGPDTKQITVIA